MGPTIALARPYGATVCALLDIVLPYICSKLLGLICSFFIGVRVDVLPIVLTKISSKYTTTVQEGEKTYFWDRLYLRDVYINDLETVLNGPSDVVLFNNISLW